MSVFHNNALIGAGGGAAAADAAVATKSLRFNNDDSAHLTRTPSSGGNQKTWTWSGWVKRSSVSGSGTYPDLFGAFFGNSSRYTSLRFDPNDKLFFFGGAGSPATNVINLQTSQVFRDFSAWYHIVLAFDTTQSTASNRAKLYVNGAQITDFDTETYPAQNVDYFINQVNVEHVIGSFFGTLDYLDGYLADVYFIDGVALDPTSFGAYNSSGVWQAAAYSGTYGTNGFHLLDFANESTIGHDSSGNENDFTANNLQPSDGAISSPTRFSWGTADTGWSLSDSNYTATYTTTAYAQVYSGALGSSTTYHFFLSEKPADNNGGWFFSDSTSVSNTHPDELSGNTLGLRTGESGIGAYGTFATANGNTGQNAITGFSDITTSSGSFHYSEWVINMTARKVWVRSLGSSSWIKGGDPTNSSSTPSFSLPTGTIYFGYVAFANNQQVKLVTSVTGVGDVLFDVPTNGDQSDTGAGGEVSGNYATMNPLTAFSSPVVLSNGNLDVSTSGLSEDWTGAVATIAQKSGKWYAEFNITAKHASNHINVGINPLNRQNTYLQGDSTSGHYYTSDGKFWNANSLGGSYASYDAGDVIGVAVDMDTNNDVKFYKNGSLQGTVSLNSNITTYGFQFAVAPYAQGGSTVTSLSCNFGQRAFAHSAPSGYKALNTASLPTPTIADGSDYFDTVLYTGTGAAKTISGLNLSPDMAWIKERNDTNWHRIIDVVRGQKELFPNEQNAEASFSQGLNSFNSDGFTLGTGSDSNVNTNNNTYVGWLWDAGSSTVTNTSGSVNSSVRANPTAGFSIAAFTVSSDGNVTVGHGLGAVPEFIIVKRRTGSEDWYVHHTSLASDKMLKLNSTGVGFNSDVGNSTLTNTLFNHAANAGDHIAYSFTSVAGYSAFGSYEGNGSSDGPFVHTGFRPALVIIKRSDSAEQWYLNDTTRDTFNVTGKSLRAQSSGAEASTGGSNSATWDILSNGFKLRDSGGGTNASGGDYIYMAWAENPFQSNGGLAR